MKNKIWVFLFLSFPIQVFGQTDTMEDYSEFDSSNVFTVIEEMPVFLKGGDDGLLKIIEENFKYPPAAFKERIGGRVIVSFTIDTSGNLIDINMKEGIREDIDQEALRLVGLLTPWKPGIQNNKKVKVKYSIPIYFWPDDRFKNKYLKSKKNDDWRKYTY